MLTKAVRRIVCVHEAAHAVIYALGGATIYRVAVAPEGSESWSYQARKGPLSQDIWGICETSDLGPAVGMWCKWDEPNGGYLADRNGFNALIARAQAAGMRHAAAAQRRELRAHVCGMLAGPIGECILTKADFDIWALEECFCYERNHDITLAVGLSRLLPWRNELFHLIDVTEAALRTPAIWARVLALADELERAGALDDVGQFLPDQAKTWPPSWRSQGRLS